MYVHTCATSSSRTHYRRAICLSTPRWSFRAQRSHWEVPSENNSANAAHRIDVPRRLRRAILLNDLDLVRRIVRTNPAYLRNPDLEDKSDTSLHLAARCGFKDVVTFLIDSGHEAEAISRNADMETPLMQAAKAGKEDVAVLLAKSFPACIPWQDKDGLDVLMHTTRTPHGTVALIPLLITLSPTLLTLADSTGNTALHHASAAGELKSLRLLLTYGANPLATNLQAWTPVHYSATAAAEAYFKSLIIEVEKKKAEGRREAMREREAAKEREAAASAAAVARDGMAAGGGGGGGGGASLGMRGGVRIVTDGEMTPPLPSSGAPVITPSGLPTPGAGGAGFPPPAAGPGTPIPAVPSISTSEAATRQRARDDAAIAGLPMPRVDWSPVERRRAMTPTEGRGGGAAWPFLATEGVRPRADTGESL